MSYVLRNKDYKQGDRYAFYEYVTTHRDGTVEIEYERLKYAEIFDNIEDAVSEKLKVDPESTELSIVNLIEAEDEYYRWKN